MNDPRYLAARDICKHHARSFYFASFFLPEQKRFASYAVYAFCRLLDDSVDENPGRELEEIERFERALDDVYTGKQIDCATAPQSLAVRAFAETVRKYNIPQALFLDLAQGCRMDLTVARYQNWIELEKYCYHVAGVVGLIMSCVFGLSDETAKANAVQMGNAMQLTNILRDVKEDWDRGRVYLPQDEMARFGYTDADVAASRVNNSFVALMKFQIDRARSMYAEGAKGLACLADDGSRFTASAMAAIYSGILDAIEKQRYDVYSKRAHLSTLQKFGRLPLAWRMKRGGFRR